MRFGEVPASHDLFADNDAIPPGFVLMTASDVAPSGWVMCDGQGVGRATPLGVKLAGQFGAGDGSTTYNVPNYNKRYPLGKFAASNVGLQGGQNDHSHTPGGYALPSHLHPDGTLGSPNHAHAHTLTLPDHSHTFIVNENRTYDTDTAGNMAYFVAGSTGGTGVWGIGGGIGPDGAVDVSGSTATTTPTLTGSLATAEAPWQAINFMVKL